MSNKILITNSSFQTKKLAYLLAKEILKKPLPKRAIVLGLKGELGSGKTTFLQGFAKGLEVKEKILSPTFILMKKFQIPKSKIQINSKIQNPKFKNFYHLDCYRVQGPKELLDLGFKKIVSNPQNIVAIEWADRVLKIAPKDAIWIEFKFVDEKTRKIKVWKKRN